jgi:hypothetical protein
VTADWVGIASPRISTPFFHSPAEIKEMAEIMAAHDNLNDILQKRKISFISFISAGH